MTVLQQINWSDPRSLITPHFSVHEAVYLPSWGVYHMASETERAQLVKTCQLLEVIRARFGDHSLNVHCMIRPNTAMLTPEGYNAVMALNGTAAQNAARDRLDYNAYIGSVAKHSPHIYGQAADFSISGWDCDDIRAELAPELERMDICMECIPGANWVHIDTFAPSVHGGARYFRV